MNIQFWGERFLFIYHIAVYVVHFEMYFVLDGMCGKTYSLQDRKLIP